VVLNTIQSLFASLTGSIYVFSSSQPSSGRVSIFPTNAIIAPLLLISTTSSLASPLGYASLAHVDYLTFVLAKSCKLLPVMFLQITLFQRRYPLSKSVIVLAVTAGVAIFHSIPPAVQLKIKGESQA
jgi:solute carrier family 35 (UDP-galactose transporter), member B1